MSEIIRVVIADDHPIYRQGLRQIFDADATFAIVAEASDGDEALRAVVALQPAVAVLDLGMPHKDGFEVAQAVRDAGLATAIVFLTMHKDEHYLRASLDAGAKGYVPKDSAVAEIGACVRAVAAGQVYISPTLTPLLMRRREATEAFAREHPELAQLTPSEQRILKLIALGLTSRTIADRLTIGVRTVERHRNNIAVKLGLQGSHALVRFAVRNEAHLS